MWRGAIVRSMTTTSRAARRGVRRGWDAAGGGWSRAHLEEVDERRAPEEKVAELRDERAGRDVEHGRVLVEDDDRRLEHDRDELRDKTTPTARGNERPAAPAPAPAPRGGQRRPPPLEPPTVVRRGAARTRRAWRFLARDGDAGSRRDSSSSAWTGRAPGGGRCIAPAQRKRTPSTSHGHDRHLLLLSRRACGGVPGRARARG